MEFSIPGVSPVARGKVRDIYALGDRLLLVATDRISAFDVILPRAIPDKGAILTGLSAHWFGLLQGRGFTTHLVSTEIDDLPEPYRGASRKWGTRPRFMLVEKLEMVPIECVARGYLAGSGWKEYQKSGAVCGIQLPAGLQESAELSTPIFTPATKSKEGHDINISFEEACAIAGEKVMEELRRLTLAIYSFGRDFARERGVILADTKFEFGRRKGSFELVLGDEVLTPDSSRYWPSDGYRPGGAQPSFDKQFVRDYLLGIGWKGEAPAPDLPDNVVEGTVNRYQEIYRRLTGRDWDGKPVNN